MLSSYTKLSISELDLGLSSHINLCIGGFDVLVSSHAKLRVKVDLIQLYHLMQSCT